MYGALTELCNSPKNVSSTRIGDGNFEFAMSFSDRSVMDGYGFVLLRFGDAEILEVLGGK